MELSEVKSAKDVPAAITLTKHPRCRHTRRHRRGIISCIAPNLDGSLYAVGSYEGSIYLYDERCNGAVSSLDPGTFTCKGVKINSRKAMKASASSASDMESIAERAKERWMDRNVGLGITSLKWGVEGEVSRTRKRMQVCWGMGS